MVRKRHHQRYHSGLCVACGYHSEFLVKHHWVEPPNTTIYTKWVCLSCNMKLRQSIFMPSIPKLHILPPWKIQRAYIRAGLFNQLDKQQEIRLQAQSLYAITINHNGGRTLRPIIIRATYAGKKMRGVTPNLKRDRIEDKE